LRICVVALGKIGLPLAVQFASKGHEVVGTDVDANVVSVINEGKAPFPGETELTDRLATAVTEGRLSATTDTVAAVAHCETVVVVAPLVVDDRAQPDFRAIDVATAAVADGLQPGTLVSYETTLPIHTTRTRFTPALAEGSGLTPGSELFVTHSPERVLTGRVFADLRRYPKLIGGIDENSAKRATAFYEAVLDFDDRPDLDRPNGVWDLGSAEAAEFAKLAETTYRDVNIALANEFARFADRIGVDFSQVAEAANSQPYSHLHRPGIAVGGHCIPVYPRFYLSDDPQATLPAAARQVNDSMPGYAADLLEKLVGPLADQTVVVLGAAYRGGVKETALSGVFPLVAELAARGATPLVHDPLYTTDELRQLAFQPHVFGDPCDAAVVQTDHREYRELAPADLPGIRALVDGRNITTAEAWKNLPRWVIGRGG
jgi:nucleotide sugar dehydrogenase